jgi:hypothetical protein
MSRMKSRLFAAGRVGEDIGQCYLWKWPPWKAWRRSWSGGRQRNSQRSCLDACHEKSTVEGMETMEKSFSLHSLNSFKGKDAE